MNTKVMRRGGARLYVVRESDLKGVQRHVDESVSRSIAFEVTKR